MSRIRRIAPGLGRGGLLGNTEGPESYLRELDTLPSQFCRATGGTETVISQGGKFYRVHTFTDTDPTSLLLNFDGSNGSTTFTDDSGWGHAVTANGNAQISTTESKFGGSSLALDGTGDYLNLNGGSAFAFGTGSFTIEGFIFLNTTTGFQIIYDQRPAGSATALSPTVYLDGASLKYYVNGADRITAGATLSTGTWYHIAISRSGTSTKMFLDGVQTGSTYTDSNSYANGSNRPVVGADGSNTANNHFPGYIDSLRITKGQALYTSAFTPPTQALTRVGSGSLTFSRGGAVEYLVVGGGGGGGGAGSTWANGGGGGAGGYRFGSKTISAASESVFVGDGGSGGAAYGGGQAGGSSSFAGVAGAGGGGGSGFNVAGSAGGSGGGGGGYTSPPGSSNGYAGNTPSVSPSQGNSGGNGQNIASVNSAGGGGGGIGSAGSNGSSGVGGNGGGGETSSISGTSQSYAGGGGGGGAVTGGSGGSSVGGSGASGNTNGSDATENTGGGGGGGGGEASGGGTLGGSGGSGIVIARYRITQAEYEAEAA